MVNLTKHVKVLVMLREQSDQTDGTDVVIMSVCSQCIAKTIVYSNSQLSVYWRVVSPDLYAYLVSVAVSPSCMNASVSVFKYRSSSA